MKIPPVLVYASAAALCFGLSSPLQKLALKHGASIAGISLLYGGGIMAFATHQREKTFLYNSALAIIVFMISVIGLSIVILAANKESSAAYMFGSSRAAVYGALQGLVAGFALQFVSKAFDCPDSLVSIITPFIATMFPIISIGVSMVALDEARHLHLAKFISGIALLLSGLYIAFSSAK